MLYGTIPAFDHCSMIPEDYKLLSEFFDKVYRHINEEDVDLKDIEVN
jgi:predicted RNA-binding protein